MRVASLVALATAAALMSARLARAQSLDGGPAAAPPPGIPALFCAGCDKPPRVRLLPRLALPLLVGAVYGRTPASPDAGLALAIGARPELTVGPVSEREQRPGRVHAGVYVEGLLPAPLARGPLFGGGGTVALTTGEITGVALSLGAYARRLDAAAIERWRVGGVASLYAGVWMPDVALSLVPTLGVRVDARYGGEGERSVAVSLQIDPVVVGLMLAGLAA